MSFTDEDVTAGAIALIGKGATPEQIADWDEEVRAVLSAVLPDHDKRVRAEAYARGHRDAHLLNYAQAYGNGRRDALREAADELERWDVSADTLAVIGSVVSVLRARADAEGGK